MLSPLAPGTLIFNRYEVVGLTGQSEFGSTYLAQDQTRFQELCMLQEFVPLQQDPLVVEHLRQQFHQRATLLYQLQHLQLPRYQIMFSQGERLYLARDYILGKSYSALLNERRAEGKGFTQLEVLQLLLHLLPVLAQLHRLGLVHQNLSPKSIVLRHPEQVPVLIDFGLIKYWVARLQLHPVLPNTPIGAEGYTPPEALEAGMAHPGVDLYALGAIAIALLLGKPANELGERGLRSPHWETQVSLHPEFAQVLKRLVHPKPHKRFATGNQVLTALQPLLPLVLAFAPATPARSRAPSLKRQGPVLATSGSNTPALSLPNKVYAAWASADLRSSAVLVVSVALLVSVVSIKALSWVQTNAEPDAPTAALAPPPDPPEPSATPAPDASPTPSPALPTREPPGNTPTENRDRSPSVDTQFLAALTDEIFYAKYPDLQGKPLSQEASQQPLRDEWNAMSREALAKLEQLSPAVRQKLGRYQREDYDRWIAPENGASVNGRELNVMVNQRFGDLFPDQKGKTLNPRTFGQIWYAIADEEITKLKPQP